MTIDLPLGDRFFGTRVDQFERLSKIQGEPGLTATQLFEKAGLLFDIHLRPAIFEHNGEFYQDDKYRLIVRGPTAWDNNLQVFGTCKGDYQALQPIDMAASLDLLVDEWPIKYVGELNNGKTLYTVLQASQFDIGKDTIQGWFIVRSTSDGGTAITMSYLAKNFFCTNMLPGLGHSAISALIMHSGQVAQKVDFRTRILAKLQKSEIESQNMFQRMAQIAITSEIRDSIINAAYRMPTVPKTVTAMNNLTREDLPDNDGLAEELFGNFESANATYEYRRERIQSFRDAALYTFDRANDHNPDVANTLWTAVNAVVEVSDWREGASTVDENSIFGARAKEKEYAMKEAEKWLR